MLNKNLNVTVILAMLALLTACNGGGGGGGGSESATVRARLIDAPVQGVEYFNLDGNRDITLSDGGYYCVPGQLTRFFVGRIKLGEITCTEGNKVYMQDLIPGEVKDTFDTTKVSPRVALLLLQIDSSYLYGDNVAMLKKPEDYINSSLDVVNGTDVYFGPDSLVITANTRALLNDPSYDNSIFTDDVALLNLINALRCNYKHVEPLATCVANHPVDADYLADINDGIAGAIKHMEWSLYIHSGVLANGSQPTDFQ